MKNELNKNIDCLITKSIIVKKILAFHQHMNTYKPKFWRWFAVVCGGLRWFAVVCGGLAVFLTAHGHTDVLSSQILVVVCGGLRWCVVVCGGLWWFAVVCGGLWWIAVVGLLVIPATTSEISRIIVRCRSHSSDVFPIIHTKAVILSLLICLFFLLFINLIQFCRLSTQTTASPSDIFA